MGEAGGGPINIKMPLLLLLLLSDERLMADDSNLKEAYFSGWYMC